jgi:hypothetical protein
LIRRIALVVLFSAACASTPNSADDRAAAVRAALRDLGGGETVKTLVVGEPDRSAELRAALARSLTVVSEADVPQTDRESLPAGYARLQSIDIDGNQGTLRLQVGPIPKAAPGEISLACGTTYSFALHRINGHWHAMVSGVAVC